MYFCFKNPTLPFRFVNTEQIGGYKRTSLLNKIIKDLEHFLLIAKQMSEQVLLLRLKGFTTAQSAAQTRIYH